MDHSNEPQLRTGETCPIFRIFDEAKATLFYVDHPGFVVDWQHRFAPDLPRDIGDAAPGAADWSDFRRNRATSEAAAPGSGNDLQ